MEAEGAERTCVELLKLDAWRPARAKNSPYARRSVVVPWHALTRVPAAFDDTLWDGRAPNTNVQRVRLHRRDEFALERQKLPPSWRIKIAALACLSRVALRPFGQRLACEGLLDIIFDCRRTRAIAAECVYDVVSVELASWTPSAGACPRQAVLPGSARSATCRRIAVALRGAVFAGRGRVEVMIAAPRCARGAGSARPGKPPFLDVKRPSHPDKNTIEKRFTVENAKAA